jgi:hypothetical protein
MLARTSWCDRTAGRRGRSCSMQYVSAACSFGQLPREVRYGVVRATARLAVQGGADPARPWPWPDKLLVTLSVSPLPKVSSPSLPIIFLFCSAVQRLSIGSLVQSVLEQE